MRKVSNKISSYNKIICKNSIVGTETFCNFATDK